MGELNRKLDNTEDLLLHPAQAQAPAPAPAPAPAHQAPVPAHPAPAPAHPAPAPPPPVPAPPAQEVANHALPPDIVDELVNTDDNAKRIRTLVKYYFTVQERLNSNVNGKRGRNALDPVRIQLLRDQYFRFTNTPAGMRDHELEWVTSKIDEDTRNVRKMVKRARANHIQQRN